MNRLTRQLKSYRDQFVAVVRNEFRAVFTDEGALLIVVFALFIYSVSYSLAYGPQVLRNVPIGVVDNSHTAASRQLTTLFDAGPNAYVAYEPTDMEEARELFFQRRIYGIVYIPSDYERRLLDGRQADVAIYVDASYFLMYRQVFQELVATIGLTGAEVGLQRSIARGAELPQAEAIVQPVVYQSHNLFNPYLGYGS
ncbi:MAG: ABC transporter permease, partial [Bacteroides cellulosilyticus]|nr:ABC transporter permease [Bacteroides cellulosilyticus]